MKKEKDRGNTTVAELIDSDTWHRVPGQDPSGIPHLTIPVRDWLKRFLAGDKTPFADSINPDQYRVIELVVAVMQDKHEGGEMIPTSAIEYVEEWLYRLEEETDLHIWTVADIARPFLAHALGMDDVFAEKSSGTMQMEVALGRLCTEAELASFYERHGLHTEEQPARKGSQQWRDKWTAIKAARVLADPTVPTETKKAIGEAMLELSTASGVTVDHPALAERALTLMFESKQYVTGKAGVKQSRKRVRDLVNAVPDGDHTRKPASLKK